MRTARGARRYMNMEKDKRHIEVVAAVMVSGCRVFATQRGYGEWKGWWEFPGGKVKVGEDLSEALRREIKEELATEISVGPELACVQCDYPGFGLTMHCFTCKITGKAPTLLEHESACWLSSDNLHKLKWLPADAVILNKVTDFLRRMEE